MYNEFVVEYRDGTRDWVDPAKFEYEDDNIIYIESLETGSIYEFEKDKISKWTIRPYSPDTTYDWIK